jgi:hypothetical protein
MEPGQDRFQRLASVLAVLKIRVHQSEKNLGGWVDGWMDGWMETSWSYGTLVPYHITTGCHNTQDRDLNLQRVNT